jgi:hypothetical protein
MALPTLSKTGVTTFTFPVERTLIGGYRPIDPRQLSGETASGSVLVVDLGQAESVECHFEDIPTADVTLLYAFFEDALIRWGRYTFTWTDELGATQTVRYWPPMQRFDAPEIAPGLHEVSFTLRVDT